MTRNTIIREAMPSDIPAMKSIIDSTELFPSEMLAAMMAPFLNGNEAGEVWLVLEHAGSQIGLAYCAPERMTEGTKNLLLIAIHKHSQGRGYGTAILARLEDVLRGQSSRVLLVETSGLPAYEATRRFYRNSGFAEEARIRDFYKAGEDKVVFWKLLER